MADLMSASDGTGRNGTSSSELSSREETRGRDNGIDLRLCFRGEEVDLALLGGGLSASDSSSELGSSSSDSSSTGEDFLYQVTS